MSMLDVRELRITYGRAVAVKSLDLHVDEGEFVSLIGHNGVGKSSTVKAIAGALKPAGGTITFQGNDITGRDSGAILRLGVAVVPEGRRIFTRLTVRENLVVGGTTRKDRSGVQASVDEMMDRFPILGKYSHRMAGLLSGGEQQQLAIARALMSQPKLLLLDEPSLGLGPGVAKGICDTLMTLDLQGGALLIAEQNRLLIDGKVDRVLRMHGGELAPDTGEDGIH